MSDNVTPFPTEEYVDKLSLDRVVGLINDAHKGGSMQHLVAVRFDKNGDVSVLDTGGMTLAQYSYAISCLQHHLMRWMDK